MKARCLNFNENLKNSLGGKPLAFHDKSKMIPMAVGISSGEIPALISNIRRN